MRVLVTGSTGYIGPIMVEVLKSRQHNVVGLDSGLFTGCNLEPLDNIPTKQVDVRDVTEEHLRGIDAIVHLAALSNDPLGTLDPGLTTDINALATIRLAKVARDVGVQRFLISSSCSVYGAPSEPWVDEDSALFPVTAYGRSKAEAEVGLAQLATDTFCVASLRNATAFGYSPMLRADVVVNDLTAGAFLHHELRLNSDGSAWRPLIHIRDIAQAFMLALEAPADTINGKVFNVGSTDQNYTVLEIANTVASSVPGARLTIADGAGPDKRSYRVRFDRVQRLLPGFQCAYNLERGIRELVQEFQRIGLTSIDRCVRLERIRARLASGDVDSTLRVRTPVTVP